MKRILVALAALIFSVSAIASENLMGVLKQNFKTAATPVSKSGPGIKGPRILAIYPTFFFQQSEGKLFQIARVEIMGASQYLVIRATRPGGVVYDNVVGLKADAIIKIPDLREPAPLELTVIDNGKTVQTLKYDWKPEKLWKIYISFVSHFDLGYTDYQDKVGEKRNKITQTALDYAEQTKDWPEDSRYRWTAEASWEIKNFLAEHPEKAPELKKLAQEGRLEVCAKLSHMHAETAGYEELFRELYYAKRELEPMLGVDVVTANETDVDGYTWGEATVLPSSGVKYFQFNPNWSYRGGLLVHATKFPQAFYWQGPDGKKILTWRSKDSYGEAPFLLKGYGATLPGMTKFILAREKEGLPYDALHLTRTGPEWDNTIPKIEPVQAIRLWDEDFAYPRLISATPKMFFSYLEKNFSAQIPLAKGDMPDWWADGVITEAKEEGVSRELHHRLFELEALAAIAGVIDGSYQYPVKEIDQAYYNNILFDEHTWGFHNPLAEEHKKMFGTKAGWLHQGFDSANKMESEVLQRVAGQVAGPGMSIVVFNPLSWKRSDLVSFSWQGQGGKYAKVVDAETGEELPVQFEESGQNLKVYFIAQDLPALGYKCYKVLPARKKPEYPSTMTVNGGLLENERFSLFIEDGKGLSSIKDKKLGRELLQGEAGQFIFREQNSFNLLDLRSKGKPELVRFVNGPVFASAVLTIKDPGNYRAVITQEVRIYRGLDWIDVKNNFSNYENKLNEGRYFAFPFDVPDFEIWLETPYGKMRPFYDQLPDYAKFYVVSHNIELRSKSENFSVVWSTRQAPMAELGEITKLSNQSMPIYMPGKYPWNPDRPAIFSEIMNNYQSTNFSFSQAGSADWDYRITALADADRDAAHQSGWELSSPALAVVVDSGTGKLPAAAGFVKLAPGNVMVAAFKMAEDKSGYIVRVYETEGKAAKAELEFPLFKVTGAWLADGMENEQSKLQLINGKIAVELGPYEVKTIKVKLQNK
jgi:hypothetical protein